MTTTLASQTCPMYRPEEQVTTAFTERLTDVAATRDATRRLLARARPGHTDDQEAAVLVVSELVTNAIRHTRGPGALNLRAHQDGLDVYVQDSSTLLPQPRLPDLSDGTGGLGCHLVTALCDRYDATADATGGKTVHAHLPWAGIEPVDGDA